MATIFMECLVKAGFKKREWPLKATDAEIKHAMTKLNNMIRSVFELESGVFTFNDRKSRCQVSICSLLRRYCCWEFPMQMLTAGGMKGEISQG